MIRHFLYFMLDHENNPIYVGCTKRPKSRYSQHVGSTPYFKDMVTDGKYPIMCLFMEISNKDCAYNSESFVINSAIENGIPLVNSSKPKTKSDCELDSQAYDCFLKTISRIDSGFRHRGNFRFYNDLDISILDDTIHTPPKVTVTLEDEYMKELISAATKDERSVPNMAAYFIKRGLEEFNKKRVAI